MDIAGALLSPSPVLLVKEQHPRNPQSSSARYNTPLDSLSLSPQSRQLLSPGLSHSLGAFLGQPNPNFGTTGSAAALTSAQQTRNLQASDPTNSSRAFTSVTSKVLQIVEKLKLCKVPGLSDCMNLVNGLAGALTAGSKGDFTTCANELLKVGKSALAIAKASGKTLTKLGTKSIPGLSLVINGWGSYDASNKARKAYRSGNNVAALLWETKSLCDTALTAMSALQLITLPTAVLPAGLEAGILTLSLVSVLVADVAEAENKPSGSRSNQPGRRP